MPTNYDTLVSKIEEAGYFATSVEIMGEWDRITICALRVSGKLCGNSFWATKLPQGLFISTWNNSIYEIDPNLLGAFCVALFTNEPNYPVYDFPEELKEQFLLSEVSVSRFDKLIGE